MRHIVPYPLWIGHIGDARNLRGVLDAGIAALVDLALNEPPVAVTRELVYCRFPLVDGTGNAPGLLRLAMDTTASLLRSQTPTLVYCSVGMSRSQAITAAALAMVESWTLEKALTYIGRFGNCDVSPGLWQEISQHSGRVDS